MSSESAFEEAVAEVLASDQRRTFLAYVAEELSIAGRTNYPSAGGDASNAARIARFASLNEALHVLGAQLASDAGHGPGYPDAAFAEALLGKAGMYEPDSSAVRFSLSRALERVKASS